MRNLLALSGCLLFISPAFAQSLGNSPYSRYGLGDQATPGFTRNAGMAGVGVASPAPFQINELNPALLPYNNQVIFELGITGQYKKLATESKSQKDANATLRYLALSLPIGQRTTIALGLKPFSSVSYKLTFKEPVIGDPTSNANIIYEGKGNVSEAFLTTGFKIYKGLTAGVGGSFVFGNLITNAVSSVVDSDGNTQGNLVVLQERNSVRNFALKGGLAYRAKLKDKLFFNVGGTYQHFLSGNASKLLTYSSIATVDTLTSDSTTKSNLQLPNPYSFGISLDNGGRWTVSVDYSTQDWSSYRIYGKSATALQKGNRVALGGEFTPDASAVRGILKRSTYRAGVSYARLPILLRGESIKETSATFGLTLPSGRNRSLVNLAFTAGKRGTTEQSLIQDNFYRIDLGLSLNDRWFVRPKID